MSMWQINLQNIGWPRVRQTVIVNAGTLPMVEDRALQECQNHLANKDTVLRYEGSMTYTVWAECRLVGNIKIKSL